MKNASLIFSAFCLSAFFFSCEKTDLSENSSLEMDIESAKANKKNLAIGMEYQGGIIFYIDETGRHGLIAAKEDLGPATWGCYGTSIPGAQSRDDGYSNTQAILAACKEPGIAARLCNAYVAREKGDKGKKYDDWFLPSLNQLFNIASIKGEYGMCGKIYSVSSEAFDHFYGFPVNAENSIWGAGVSCNSDKTIITGMYFSVRSKSLPLLVRPIRVF